MKTELAAFRTWCPKAIVNGSNRTIPMQEPSDWNSCIGSRCAVWQWGESETKTVPIRKAAYTKSIGHHVIDATEEQPRFQERRGWCGLIATRGVE
ncbi:MAG TPA: hypothetical protein VF077_13190 [Nitrospiraceae bacterium]